MEAIAALDTQAREYERICQRRILSGFGPDDPLILGAEQVASEFRASIAVLEAESREEQS
jgi:hypothetical protein